MVQKISVISLWAGVTGTATWLGKTVGLLHDPLTGAICMGLNAMAVTMWYSLSEILFQ